MNARLEQIFNAIPSCDTFADIGCDHGYMAAAMLKSGKCKRAIISDVSAKCLKKAQELLKEYIDNGVVVSVVSDGFDNLPESDLALIAGMGGEEIVSIISKAKALPENLVLQPMKNVDKVRVEARKAGYRIIKDYVFFTAGVFYDLIVLKKGEDTLSKEEIEFGRTNLKEKGQAFIERNKLKIDKLKTYLAEDNLAKETREQMLSEIKKLENYV